MIYYKKGNILESQAEALVNTVNTQGIMGKGIALQFKKEFPKNHKIYQEAYKRDELAIGKLLIVEDSSFMTGKKMIINFPTKTTWRKPSEYQYIENGLDELVKILPKYQIKSIALPPLGSGNGGLNWEKVKSIIQKKLASLSIDIYIYEPSTQIQEILKKERVQLTDARAMLLSVLYELVQNGEFVSEFSSEKICYFLQRFGAKEYFKLNYSPNFYGPYSGKVKYVINYLNGSYIMGYSAMDKKPFDPLYLVPDGIEKVEEYIKSKPELLKIVKETKDFLEGFYSDFALELLSTVDYITFKEQIFELEKVKASLNNWSDRKRTLFSNDRFVNISLDHIKKTNFSY